MRSIGHHGRETAAPHPIVLSLGEVVDGVTLELVPGATLEGQVLAPPGSNLRGKIIAISRGDGHVAWKVTSDERFRFTDLAPGRWQIRNVAAEHQRLLARARLGPARMDAAPATIVALFSGKTTVCNLDLREGPPMTGR